MAKGLRSSTNKANNSKLRSRVFGPVEEARKERLSAKLLELASQPKATKSDDVPMINDETAIGNPSKRKSEPSDNTNDYDQEMDIDGAKSSDKRSTSGSKGRIQKRGRGKASAAMVFPVYKKGKRVGPKLSARQRKQSLKPK